MKFITCNVNGIRACAKKGFVDSLIVSEDLREEIKSVKAHSEVLVSYHWLVELII